MVMMKKIAVCIVVLLLLVTVVPNGTVGEPVALYLQGHAYDSHDGIAVWNRGEGVYSGNITAIDINDPNVSPRGADDAINDGKVNEDEGKGTEFYWDATPVEKLPHAWSSLPDLGNNIIFLGEYQHYDKELGHINYTWASNYIAEYKYTPLTQDEHVVKYEPIPKPEVNPYVKEGEAIGPTWINISIPNFKYTSSTIEGEQTSRGTYDLHQSYAVFIRQEKDKEWRYIGNSKVDPNNMEKLNEPLLPTNSEMDPNRINTGSQYFLAEDLKPDTGYEFMVRVNFRTLDAPVNGPVWGYGGGLGDKEEDPKVSSNNNIMSTGGGTITPFGSSGSGGVFPTNSADLPSEPRNLTAYTDINHIYLDWEPPLDDGGIPLTYYVIYRNTTTGGFTYHDHVGATQQDYSDNTTVNGVEYTYYVTAMNDAGEGPPSNQASNMSIGVASEPVNLTAEDGLDCIYLDWDPPASDGGSSITEYWIYRDGSYYSYVDAPTTSFTDNSVTNGVEYIYYIRARNSVGIGPAGNSDSAVPYTMKNITLSTTNESDNWVFISLSLIPDDTDIEAVLNHPTYGINGSYDRVMYYDTSTDQWQSYIPGRAAHFNRLTNIDNTMGIWIRMTGNATLTVIGLEPVNTTITLYPGWNMVGYPSSENSVAGGGLPTIEVTKIGYFDENETYNMAYNYDPGNFIFKPGKAYMIYNGANYALYWTVDY